MEAYRSGHNGPDSKSGSPHGLVGSNPTASARRGTPRPESAVILYNGESLCPYHVSFVRLDPFVRTPRSESAVILYNGESLCPYLVSFVRLDLFVRTRRSESHLGHKARAGSFLTVQRNSFIKQAKRIHTEDPASQTAGCGLSRKVPCRLSVRSILFKLQL